MCSLDTCQGMDRLSIFGLQFTENLDIKSRSMSMNTDYEYLTVLRAMKIDGDLSSECWFSTRCWMKMQYADTITRRYLRNLASSSVKYTLVADRHLLFFRCTGNHAIAGTFGDRTWRKRMFTQRRSRLGNEIINRQLAAIEKLTTLFFQQTTWLDERTNKYYWLAM